MERLLIAGVENEAGRHLARHFAGTTEILGVPFSVQASMPVCSLRRLTRTSPESVRLLLEADGITHVIYCGQASRSGWSAPSCESFPCSDTSDLQAWAAACAAIGIPFVFLSSDRLFDGPWVFHQEESESVAASPLAQSIRGQEAIVAEQALIVRSHICGFSPESLLTRRLLMDSVDRPERPLWYATPIYAGRFAQLLGSLIERRATGVYHLGGGERISHSQFLRRLNERFRRAPNLAAATSDTADEHRSVPRETSLRSSKTRRLLNAGLPSVSDFLDDVAADLKSGKAYELAGVDVSAPVKVA